MIDVTMRNAVLRQMLNERRSEMLNDFQRRVRDRRTDRTSDVRDDLEVSDSDAHGDLEFALLQMRAEALTRIDAALVQLDAGKYGSCFECESEIAGARLHALPFVVRCQACEERREQERLRGRQLALRHDSLPLFRDVVGA